MNYSYGDEEFMFDHLDSYHTDEDRAIIEEARDLLLTERRERFMAQQLDGALERVMAVTHTEILDLPTIEGVEDLPPRKACSVLDRGIFRIPYDDSKS